MIIYIYACWRVAQLKQVSGCVCFIKKNAMFKCPGCLYCLYKLILLSVYHACMQAVHFIFMNVEQYCIYMELTCQARPVLILYLHIASQKKKNTCKYIDHTRELVQFFCGFNCLDHAMELDLRACKNLLFGRGPNST